MSVLTGDERKILRAHLLRDSMVQTALAGFLYQELLNVHGVQHVKPQDLKLAIRKYVVGVDTLLGDAESLLAAGVRPRNWSGEAP